MTLISRSLILGNGSVLREVSGKGVLKNFFAH